MAKEEAPVIERNSRKLSCLYCARCQYLLPMNGYYVHCLGCNSFYHFECSGQLKEAYTAKSEAERRHWRCTGCRVRCSRSRAMHQKPRQHTPIATKKRTRRCYEHCDGGHNNAIC